MSQRRACRLAGQNRNTQRRPVPVTAIDEQKLRRRKRSRPPGGKRELLRAEYPHHVWAIDFQFDQTMDGRTLKFLNVIDEYSRLCLAIRVGRRCRAAEVIDTIEELLKLYPPPTHLRMEKWRGIHRQRLAGVECRERLQYGLHPTRFTMGEPIRGIVQQPVQG